MIIDETDFLEHYGVKGMKWGVRNDRPKGTSRKTDRTAKKDAKEFARAKMYYGQGAGTRRKLIKNTVEARKKGNTSYSEAFERHLSKQDMADHASRASSQRTRTDRVDRNKKRAGAVARRVTGEWGTQAAFVGVAAMGVAYARSPRGRQVLSTSMNKVSSFVNSTSASDTTDFLSAYFQRNG